MTPPRTKEKRAARRLGLCLALLVCSRAPAEVVDLIVPPEQGERFRSSQFRLWLPDGVKTLRAVIVKQHGCGRNGLSHPLDAQWQALARRWNAGLLGSHFEAGSTNCSDWSRPEFGSERAFLHALAYIAEFSRHPELEHAPWVLWGHSGGAAWALLMTQRHPNRVVAVFAQSGAATLTNTAAWQVPVWCNRGVEDFPAIISRVQTAFETARRADAPWALSVDPNAKHECGSGRLLALPFFDAMLTRRLPAAPALTNTPPLTSVRNERAAWWGNPRGQEIQPVGAHPAPPLASWFANQAAAQLWQEFSRSGSVADSTPPPRPRSVTAKAAGKSTLRQVTIQWKADVDPESGWRAFHIYRDDRKIGSVPQESASSAPAGFFQAGNYGDEPEPENPAMEFTDTQPPPGKHVYRVRAVNGSSLPSEPSRPASVRVR